MAIFRTPQAFMERGLIMGTRQVDCFLFLLIIAKTFTIKTHYLKRGYLLFIENFTVHRIYLLVRNI
nr:MAG TPA: Non-structural protein 1 Protein, Immune Antagonist [Caudoviricetes sp.]